jgi:hypothetical protein
MPESDEGIKLTGDPAVPKAADDTLGKIATATGVDQRTIWTEKIETYAVATLDIDAKSDRIKRSLYHCKDATFPDAYFAELKNIINLQNTTYFIVANRSLDQGKGADENDFKRNVALDFETRLNKELGSAGNDSPNLVVKTYCTFGPEDDEAKRSRDTFAIDFKEGWGRTWNGWSTVPNPNYKPEGGVDRTPVEDEDKSDDDKDEPEDDEDKSEDDKDESEDNDEDEDDDDEDKPDDDEDEPDDDDDEPDDDEDEPESETEE